MLRIIKKPYQQLLEYVREHFSKLQYMMLLAVITGLVAGLIAVLLKVLVHHIQVRLQPLSSHAFLHLLTPAFGLLITVVIVKKFFRQHLDRGIALVLKAIARQSSYLPLSHTYSHIITSSITVGLGGSLGLESPIVATGSAIGSNIARISETNYAERTLLIACGAAAGISAAFDAPIAGVIFAIEVLLTETVVSYFIPLIIASVTGVLCSKILLQEEALFQFVLQQKFDYHNIPFYVILGVLGGLVSRYYAFAFKATEHRVHTLKMSVYTRAILAGILLMTFFWLLPPLFGEGYSSVKLLANGKPQWLINQSPLLKMLPETAGLLLFTLLIVLMKPVAAGITIGGGGNGGNFAPSLFSGAFLGYFTAKLINLLPWIKVPEGNFSLVGMAALLSGVMYSPLTAIFLIAEITQGYELFIPLMLVSSISFFMVKAKNRFSMETRKLAEEGQILTGDKEQNILSGVRLQDLLNEKYDTILPDQRLTDLVRLIKKGEKNIFAVTDSGGRLLGIIELQDIKKLLFEREKHDKIRMAQLMKKPPGLLNIHQSMQVVMQEFDLAQSWYLPVLDDHKKFLGFLSKTKLFARYREVLTRENDLL